MMARTKLAAVTAAVVVAAGLTVGTGWALQVPGLPGEQPPAAKKTTGQPPPAPAKGLPGGPGTSGAPPAGAPGEHRIKPGDRLFIRARNVFETEPIDGIYVVESSGKVALGPAYGGRVALAGKTFEEAEADIQNQVRLYARVGTVTVTAADTGRADALEERVRRLEEEVARLKAAVGAARP